MPSSTSVSFPTGFLWGAATAAYQVEGAVHEGGRGPSIWDTFSHTPGRVAGGDTGDVACDQFHRYEDDAALMADLGIGAYRFSVSWPRIQPEGRGAANRAGLDYYRRLVDSLNRHGILPMLTLYHWDLPQALEDRGGWTSRDTASRFADYADLVAGALVGEVSHWITINEPWVAAWLGYGAGVHAPGRTDDIAALAATHHLLLAHGLALEALGRAGEVGITLNLQPARPASDDEEDVRAARRVDLHTNALFLDPLYGRGYPKELVEHYAELSDMAFVRDGDLETIARPTDFLGVNYYRPYTVSADARPGFRAIEMPGSLGAWNLVPDDVEVTTMGWPIEPDGLTELLVRLHRDYAPSRMIITENGASFDDDLGSNGGVHDRRRVSYLHDHLVAAHAAIEQGVPLSGYFVWSLLDNFEWAEGYAKRFGIVHVDYETLRRTPKDSARWYGEVAGRGAVQPP
ncbi:MAG: GH1 family beta-glucosidase [Actinomycetota bacterium]